MNTRRIKQTRILPDTSNRIVISADISDITIIRDTEEDEITVKLIAKVMKEKYLKAEKNEKEKMFCISQSKEYLVIESDFGDGKCVISSELVISIPKYSKVREVVAKTWCGDVYMDSLYKRFALDIGIGNVYLDAIFNSDGDNSEMKTGLISNCADLNCRKCDSIITITEGDVFLKLYSTPKNISYQNNCEEIKTKIKECKKTETVFTSEIFIDTGSLRLEGKIVRN